MTGGGTGCRVDVGPGFGSGAGFVGNGYRALTGVIFEIIAIIGKCLIKSAGVMTEVLGEIMQA